MITFKQGNIFDQPVKALVNPVNCVGVMGAGLALQFHARYPDNFFAYQREFVRGRILPGKLFVHETAVGKIIINFPTKRHWRDPSRIEDIEAGLEYLAEKLWHWPVSVAMPRLGCGLGGLDWGDVKPLIERILSDLDYLDIIVLEWP